MAGKLPYFPFYVKDFAADATVIAMTNEQVGIYIWLLCVAWEQCPAGTLPNDDAILAKWARVPLRRWQAVKAGVLAAFTLIGDRWHQKRMKEEHGKLAERSNSARDSASRRWKKEPCERIANAYANALPRHKQNDARAFGSDSDSDSDSELNPHSGESDPLVKRHDEPPPGMPWPTFLATEWVWFFAGTQRSERDLQHLGGFFADLIASGNDPPGILANIRKPKRKRRQPSWEFLKEFYPEQPANGRHKNPGRQSHRFREEDAATA